MLPLPWLNGLEPKKKMDGPNRRRNCLHGFLLAAFLFLTVSTTVLVTSSKLSPIRREPILQQEIATPYLVQKRHLSDTARFIFFAGIEGTGHHFWAEILKKLKMHAEIFNKSLISDVGENGLQNYLWQLALAETEKDYLTYHSLAIRRMAELTTTFSRHPEEKPSQIFFMLNLLRFKGNGMMSYPNFGEAGDAKKTLQHPNLRYMADIAEFTRSDLRIIVLVRNPIDILISTTVHRDHNALMLQAKVLMQNLSVLLAQLLALDPSFFLCINMDDLSNDTFQRAGTFSGLALTNGWDLNILKAAGLQLPTRSTSTSIRDSLASSSPSTPLNLTDLDPTILAERQQVAQIESARGIYMSDLIDPKAIPIVREFLLLDVQFRRQVCGMDV